MTVATRPADAPLPRLVQRCVWERDAAPGHRLRQEGRRRFHRGAGRRVRTSGQAGAGAAVRDGRVQAAVVHHGVERGENRGGGRSEASRPPREAGEPRQ